MRIDRLDLLAFGPFTGLSLDLSAPGVHLVTGPNEAGKSSARAALDHLLYGMPLRTPYNFRHDYAALRLGAVLRRSDGATLEIVRTKARESLHTPDGTPLPESALAPFLGGVDRQTFTSVFALHSAELRAGGKTLAEGRGDVGHALAASQSGLSLTRALRAIEERIGELYKARGQHPRINARIRTLKEIRARQRRLQLRPAEYAEREERVQEARRRLARLEADLAEARREHARLDRIGQAIPALNRHRDLTAQLDALAAEGVLAPAEAAERHPALQAELHEATTRLADAGRRLDEVRGELDGLTVDETLLAHADAVEELAAERAAVQEAAVRRAEAAAEAARLRAEALDLLRQVRPDADLTDTAWCRVPEEVRAQAGRLRDRYTALETERRTARQACETRRHRLEEAEKRLSELPPAEDVTRLAAAVEAVPADLLNRLVAAEEDEARLRIRAERLLAELKLSGPPVTVLAGLTVPSADQVDAHLEACRELQRDRRDLAERTRERQAALDRQRLELAALLRDDPPPTEEDLAAARAARDALWRKVRDGADGEDGGTGAAETYEAFERALAEADRIADRMRRDARRVGERHRLELGIATAEQALDHLAREAADLDAQQAALDAEWERLWAGFPGETPPRQGARAVVELVERLRGAVAELGDASARLGALRAQARRHAARLAEVLRDPSITVSDGERVLAELPELQETAATRLAHHEEAARARAAQEERVATARAELADAEALVLRHEAEFAEWTAQWRALMVQAGLPAERDVLGALADLDRLAEAADRLARAERAAQEAAQAAAKVERFHELLATVAAACGHPVPEGEAERYLLAGRLQADCRENQMRAERRAHLIAARERLAAEAAEHRAAVDRVTAELAELTAAAGVPDEQELARAVARRTRHDALTAALAEVVHALPGGPQELPRLAAAAAETDPDRLAAELATAADRIADLERRRTEQARILGERLKELEQLDGSAAAAQAAAQAEDELAALVEETEEYLRLQVARQIVLDCLTEYRKAHQDPVLERAGRLFRALTLERFAGLRPAETDDGSAVLLAVRADGEALTVERLSEGTLDQLYLALRLASLERYAEEDRALPFVLDDVFMTFDDRRTRAALTVLDEMADRFQVIVFTHHEHHAELARASLPEDRVHVHALPEFPPPAR